MAKPGPKKGERYGGREKGTPNRFTASMKDAFLSVYQDLQDETGTEHGHLRQWALEHPSEFYKICAKMIPQQIKADVNHTVTAEDMTDAQLLAIAKGSSSGTTEKKASKKQIH